VGGAKEEMFLKIHGKEKKGGVLRFQKNAPEGSAEIGERGVMKGQGNRRPAGWRRLPGIRGRIRFRGDLKKKNQRNDLRHVGGRTVRHPRVSGNRFNQNESVGKKKSGPGTRAFPQTISLHGT